MTNKFRAGDLVTVFGNSDERQRPYIRFAGRIVKRVHPACFTVEHSGRRAKDIHPSDMMYHDGSADHREAVQVELNRRVKEWEDEDPSRAPKWEAEQKRRQEQNIAINREFGKIWNSMYRAPKKKAKRDKPLTLGLLGPLP